MIKSDKWIRSKCQQPDGYVLPTDVRATDKKNWTPVYRGKDETITGAGQRVIATLDRESSYTFASGGDELFIPMISPFEPGNIRYKEVYDQTASRDMDTDIMVKEKILSYGTSSFGYDVTLADDFRIFTNINSTIIDPLNFDEKCLVEFKGDVCIIPPNSYILGVTREFFDIPRNVMVICVGKSTYARCGAIVNVTPIEPGFKGHVVIEISNATNLPMKIYANQGIAQFLFFESDEECETSYADKAGKYQGQTGVTLAKG